MWGDIAIAFLIAFITAYVFTPFSVRLAKKVKAWDIPKDTRKVHKKLMPRLGGIAIIIGFSVSIVYLITEMTLEGKLNIISDGSYKNIIGFFIALFILEIFCYIDDTKGIKPILKFIGQVCAAIIIVKSGIVIDRIAIGEKIFITNEIFLNIFTIIWIVGITNAINLMDGLDGLSSGLSLIASVCLMIIFIIEDSPIISVMFATALAGALSGFLPFNFNPARTFMGDTGSNFIGFTLGVISIMGVAKTYTAIIIAAPILVLAIPIFDMLSAIIRRLVKSKSIKAIFIADRGHLHHKLLDKGYTQKQAVAILYGVSLILGLFAIILIDSGIWKALSFLIFTLAIVAVGYKDILKPKKQKNKVETT